MTANTRSKCATASRNERSVSQFSRSPMWCEGQARPPLATQIVLLSSAPYAVTGTAACTGRAMLAGTYPRERRTINGPSAVERTTESSVRMWIGRS